MSLHLLEKNVCFARVQGSPVTLSCIRQVPSLHFLLLMIYRISPSKHVGFPHTIVPKTVSNHRDGFNVLLNNSMKHVHAELITIVYPHPQALHSFVLRTGREVYLNCEIKPQWDCSRSGFCPPGVMMAAALHNGQLIVPRGFQGVSKTHNFCREYAGIEVGRFKFLGSMKHRGISVSYRMKHRGQSYPGSGTVTRYRQMGGLGPNLVG